jgi:hypothetical protein
MFLHDDLRAAMQLEIFGDIELGQQHISSTADDTLPAPRRE